MDWLWGVTVKKKNEGSDGGGEGGVKTEIERQNHWRSVCRTCTDRLRHRVRKKEGSLQHLRGSGFITASGGESFTGSRTRTHVDKTAVIHRLWSSTRGGYGREGGGERGWNVRLRSITATWLILGVSLSTCSGSLSTQGDWGRRGRELLRLCAGQRAPVDSPSLAAAAAAGGAGAVAPQIAAELAGAAAKQGALTPKLFIYPEMKVASTAEV